jgi:hypothetical protein
LGLLLRTIKDSGSFLSESSRNNHRRSETQSRSNMELASLREKRISNVVRENGNGFNGDTVEQRRGVEKTGQELEDDNQYDYDPDFPMVGRQI